MSANTEEPTLGATRPRNPLVREDTAPTVTWMVRLNPVNIVNCGLDSLNQRRVTAQRLRNREIHGRCGAHNLLNVADQLDFEVSCIIEQIDLLGDMPCTDNKSRTRELISLSSFGTGFTSRSHAIFKRNLMRLLGSSTWGPLVGAANSSLARRLFGRPYAPLLQLV